MLNRILTTLSMQNLYTYITIHIHYGAVKMCNYDLISISRQLLEQVNKIQKQNNKFKIELDERRNEAERFKALQNHSSHQQVLLNQLRSRLEEHEYV